MIADRTQVRLLRLRGAVAGDTTASQRAARLLAAASARPATLTRSAVLCVRCLADPRPGALRLDSGAIRPPPDWEAAVGEALEHELRAAARPAHGAVPAGANAVLFADRAELLACLAADWVRGELASRWWWIGFVGQTPPRDAVIGTWRDEPRYIPAAVELLMARGMAVRFVGALHRDEAAALAELVAAEFGLPAVVAQARRASSTAAAEAGSPDRTDAASSLPPRVAAAPAGPEPEAVVLIGLSLALRRASVELRSPRFADVIQTWAVRAGAAREPSRAPAASARVAPPPERTGPAPSLASPFRAPAAKPRQAPTPEPVPNVTPVAGDTEPPVGPEPAPPPAIAAARRSPRHADARSLHPPATPGRPRVQMLSPPPLDRSTPAPLPPASRRRTRAPAAPVGDEPPVFTADPAAPVHAPAPSELTLPARAERPPDAQHVVGLPDAAGRIVETGLGGLFFLVNLALHLGLIADFSAPDEPAAGVDPWDLVTLLGRELLDPPDPGDPVWALLAELAGREEREPPGRGFDPGDDWRLPPDWLEPWPDPGEWIWSAARARLRIRHPAGFLVVDVRDGSLERELARYGFSRARRARVSAAGARGGPATRWARRLAPYVQARLALGLGVERPAQLLLRRYARVHVTAVHVDVELTLAEHPLEIRLSGLDRDPGWLPAAGRHLAFHFR
jgi:hypothetical protein